MIINIFFNKTNKKIIYQVKYLFYVFLFIYYFYKYIYIYNEFNFNILVVFIKNHEIIYEV